MYVAKRIIRIMDMLILVAVSVMFVLMLIAI